MKSLKPFVRLGGGNGSSSSSTALYSVTAQQGSEGGFHEKQQAVELLQQCQEQLNRWAYKIFILAIYISTSRLLRTSQY